MDKIFKFASIMLALAVLTFLVKSGCMGQEFQKPQELPKSNGFDHSIFDALLQKYVQDGKVDYQELAQELDNLDKYLSLLGATTTGDFSRNEKLAFYINAYNAFTLRLILRNFGKIKSIRDIKNPWNTREWNLAGSLVSLSPLK
jgi:hypothetical protein